MRDKSVPYGSATTQPESLTYSLTGADKCGPIDAFGIFDASSSKFAITRYNGASSAAGRAPASASPAE